MSNLTPLTSYKNIMSPPTGGSEKILLAVMGLTGVGKTSFINVATGGYMVSRSSLKSSTSEIHEHDAFPYGGREIIFVDTPGFDNDKKSDISILDELVQFLRRKWSEGIYLAGIIYLHRIIDVRMGGSATKNIQLLRELCGNPFFKRLTLVTTMWDVIEGSVGSSREQELKRNYWRDVLDLGAMYRRHYGDRKTALLVIDGYFEHLIPPIDIRSNIEKQAVDSDRPLQETDAGHFALETLRQKVHQYRIRLEDKKKARREMEYDPGLEEEAAQIEQEIRKGEQELDGYRRVVAEFRGTGDPLDSRSDGRKGMIGTSKDETLSSQADPEFRPRHHHEPARRESIIPQTRWDGDSLYDNGSGDVVESLGPSRGKDPVYITSKDPARLQSQVPDWSQTEAWTQPESSSQGFPYQRGK